MYATETCCAPLTLSTHTPHVLRVPQPLSLSSYFLTVSSFIICSFLCICRGSSKLQTGKHLPSSNLGPSYCSPVHMEARDHPGSPTLSSQGSSLSGPSLLLASPIPLLTRLLLLQILLAATGSPLTSKSGSPREWSTEKQKREKRKDGRDRKENPTANQGRALSCSLSPQLGSSASSMTPVFWLTLTSSPLLGAKDLTKVLVTGLNALIQWNGANGGREAPTCTNL